MATINARAVLVRVGWMRFYGAAPGADDADELVGGGAWNLHYEGAEVDNVRVQPDGWCRGYFQPARGASGFNLGRIDASAPAGASRLDDVLVVMFATDPLHGGRHVVGWYSNAIALAEIATVNERIHLQVIVLTCRPTAYIETDELPAPGETVRDRAAGLVRTIDLERVVQRSPSSPAHASPALPT